jgi:hypothetical protein
MDLEPGPTRLQTWLEDGDTTRGAFFITIERID